MQSEHGEIEHIESEHGDKHNKHELNEHEKKKKCHKRVTKWINIINKEKNDTNGKTNVLPTFITMGSWCEYTIMWKLVKNPKVEIQMPNVNTLKTKCVNVNVNNRGLTLN